MQGEIDYEMFIIQSIHAIHLEANVVSYHLLLNVIYYNTPSRIIHIDH